MNCDNDEKYGTIFKQEIKFALDAMFPHGEGRTSRAYVEHHLRQIAEYAFHEGKTHALLGLMTAQDVADHFSVSRRRANELIRNRHQRFGIGMRIGNQWIVHHDELDSLMPDAKYRSS